MNQLPRSYLKWGYISTLLAIVIVLLLFLFSRGRNNHVAKKALPELTIESKVYREYKRPTPNYDHERKNQVIGVVLHHTAEPTVERSLEILTSRAKKVGTHVVIDTDGTRYILAEPDVATYHAGLSILNDREGCNYLTIGIEFQGNTLVAPLTDDQIASGIQYLLPIISKYKIPLKNIVTHEMVRTAYKEKYPNKKCSGKVDITQVEYKRFMDALNNKIETNIQHN